jgi:TPR repeat protein
MKRLFLISILLLSSAAWGQSLDAARAAFDRKDYATALRALQPLASQGIAEAQFRLGSMYVNGEGVPQDYVEAVKWYRLAAAQEMAEAQVMLGLMYAGGRGVPQDYVEAVKWYRLAAAQGIAEAQFRLGLMYGLGWGVSRDLVTAHLWSNLAAARGNPQAVKFRDFVAKEMTSQQIADAQKRARECLAQNYKGC